MNNHTLYSPCHHVVVTIENNLISVKDLGLSFGLTEPQIRAQLIYHQFIEPNDTHFCLTNLAPLMDCWGWEDVVKRAVVAMMMMKTTPDKEEEEQEETLLFQKEDSEVPKKRPLIEMEQPQGLKDNDGIFEKVIEEEEEEQGLMEVVVVTAAAAESVKKKQKVVKKQGSGKKKEGSWFIMFSKDNDLWPGPLEWDIGGVNDGVSAIDLARALKIEWIPFEEICKALQIPMLGDTSVRIYIDLEKDVPRILKHIGWSQEKCQRAMLCFAQKHRCKTKKGRPSNSKPRRFTRHAYAYEERRGKPLKLMLTEKKVAAAAEPAPVAPEAAAPVAPAAPAVDWTHMLKTYLDPAYIDEFMRSDEFADIKERIIAEEVAKLEAEYLKSKKNE